MHRETFEANLGEGLGRDRHVGVVAGPSVSACAKLEAPMADAKRPINRGEVWAGRGHGACRRRILATSAWKESLSGAYSSSVTSSLYRKC